MELTVEQQLRIDLLRSVRHVRLAECIYQWERGRHAKLSDLRPVERSKYYNAAYRVIQDLESS